MKTQKSIILLAILWMFAKQSVCQFNDKKIIKLTYKSSPISKYQDETLKNNEKERAKINEICNAHKRYYTLLINIENRASVYKFDSLVFKKPKGAENHQLFLADELMYCIKNQINETYKFENVLNRDFYTKGKFTDIKWEILNEKKKILGFNCTKAVPKNKEFLLTVWFTNDIPISSGPVNYFGLPGLVVWAEDYFRTTTIEKIEYLNDINIFTDEFNKYQLNFKKNNKKGFLEENLYIEKKNDLINSMRQSATSTN